MSKFKLNDREINLFCDIMQQFAEKYHTEQLRTHDAVERREQSVCPNCDGEGFSGKGTNEILPCLICFGSGEKVN